MNSQILIADSGATKTTWCLLTGNDKEYFSTIGFNPYFQSTEDIRKEIKNNLLPALSLKLTGKLAIYYYGAGCSSAEKVKIVFDALHQQFSGAAIEVQHDLLAAARALLGRNEGIAAILGTGSNSCHYNGKDIINNVFSLGFILGDEGSGAHIGKNFMRALLYKELDKELEQKFYSEYPDLSLLKILDLIYKKPLPNKFLASFAKFVHANRNNQGLKKIVENCFSEFFEKHICKYDKHTQLPLSIVGSVGHYFSEEIKVVAKKYNVSVKLVLQSPMEGLVEYHFPK